MSFIELCYEYPLKFSLPLGEDYFTMPLEVAHELGLTTEVYTIRNNENKLGAEQIGNYSVHRFRNSFSLLGNLARKKADLIHGHTLGWIPASFAPLVKNNYIFTAHTDQAKDSLQYRFAVRAISRSDKILVSTDFTKRSLLKYLPEDKIEVFPLPINYALWSTCKGGAEYRSKANIPEQLIVNVATIRPQKNYMTLLKALQIVKTSLPKTKLVIVGADPSGSIPELKRLAAQLNVEENVIFYNRASTEELVSILDAADVFVMTSTWESQCIAVYEAAAAGLPLVLSNLGIFEPFKDCAVFQEPLDYEMLAKNLLLLLEDQKFAKTHAKTGQEKMKQFDFSVLKCRLKVIYESMLKGHY
jgi:glycosyltransferase involved in cell wall biosynthesis